MRTFSITSKNSGNEYSFCLNSDKTVECTSKSHKGVIIGEADNLTQAKNLAEGFVHSQGL